ncbi:hypothetical protein [Amycolatopsis thermophila]|uniref:Uncharacterized protein n=1 Tax=Amycolatopsis thermophila TaxID=206084 RepID=A0ABU0EYA1_9PSEU|nr:hypothetical protein [Amycolatopsis thermophila]MDQ0380294.1 hypothetical protein [Amycolatopsis thermophila]
MGSVNWSERETISALLRYQPARSPLEPHWVSCLMAGLRDARSATGRDVESGNVDPATIDKIGNWLGALGYMVLLDQIGQCYRIRSVELKQPASDFVNALSLYAPEISFLEAQALWALRCSFAHNYGLINAPKIKNVILREQLTHHFLLDASSDPGAPLVRLPKVKWDGQLAHCSKFNATWVDLRSLGDLVEAIYRKLVELHDENSLVLGLPGGLAELQKRFAITIHPGLRMVGP